MNEKEFEATIRRAEGLLACRPDYIDGYIRGLRRLHHGPSFSTPQDHETWLAFAYHWNPKKAARGRGYLDGLQGIKPKI